MAVTEVYFTVSAKGQRRAWRMSPRQFRAFPMPLAVRVLRDVGWKLRKQSELR